MATFPVVFGVFLMAAVAGGADILGVFPVTSFSHQVVYRRLMVELSRRGHNVTVVTPDPARDPGLSNYREIDVSFLYDLWNRNMVADPAALKATQHFPELLYVAFSAMGLRMCRDLLSAPGVRRLVDRGPAFDLLVSEFGVYPCTYGFAKLSGYRHVGIFSLQAGTIVHADIGNPATASYIPEVLLPYGDGMSFRERWRVFAYQVFQWGLYAWTMWMHDPIAKQYFGPDLPHLVDLERNLSALFVNSHFALGYPRPNAPNVVEIGAPAFHIVGRKPKALPQVAAGPRVKGAPIRIARGDAHASPEWGVRYLDPKDRNPGKKRSRRDDSR